ncbi:MAG: ParB/RepB/Spo0J family partition protein [Planctomycetota bacterium]|nr:ParB/RepB/Spo0J family partition protein [Planctomycetota bacterium]
MRRSSSAVAVSRPSKPWNALLPGLPPLPKGSRYRSGQRVAAIVRECKSRCKAKRALLIVDYLQLLPVPPEVAERGDLHADKYRVRMIQETIEGTRTTENPTGDTVLAISEARKPQSSKEAWGQSLSELMGSSRLAASIREFGFRQPIVVDSEGVIIVGHTRWKAAKKLGLTEVPVHVATDLTAEQIRAYRIADNRLAELAEWNYDLLPIELTQLGEAGFDLDLLGFDQDELTKILNPGAKDGLTDPDDVPEPPDEAITQSGDLWILGEHRLLCGDSSNPAHVDRLLGGADIHLVNTDPPYNVKVEPRSNNAIAAGLSSFQGTTHHQGLDLARHPEKAKPTRKKLRAKDRPLANDFVSDEDFDRMLADWFGNITRVLLPGRGFYIWGGYANLRIIHPC